MERSFEVHSERKRGKDWRSCSRSVPEDEYGLDDVQKREVEGDQSERVLTATQHTSVLIQSSGSSTDTTHFTADPHQGGSGRGCGCQEDSLLEDSQTALCSSIKDTSVLHQCFSIKDTSVLHQCFSIKDTSVLHQCSKPGRHGSSHSLQCDEKKLHEVNEANSGSEPTMLTDATLSTTWLGSEIDFLCEDTSTHSTCSTDSSSLQDALQAGEEARRHSIDVLQILKRRSDGWSGLGMSGDPVTTRLKEGRKSAQRKQEDIEELLCEASAQLQIQQQASMALRMCEGRGSLEEVEAERLILLAGERYKTFRGEAQDLVLGHTATPLSGEHLHPCTAALFLMDLQVTLTQQFTHKLTSSDHVTHYFLCLVREAKTRGITATQTVSLTRQHQTLEFSNCFTLPNIPHDFEIALEVYHLHFEQCTKTSSKKFSQVVKSRISSMWKSKTTRCLLCTQSASTTSLNGPLPEHTPESLLHSRFRLIGKAFITRSSLNQGTYPIEQGEEGAKVGAIKATIFAEPDLPQLTEPLEGYLNMFTGCWERRWFALSEHTLCCWLYPDQPGRSERPLGHWDLLLCDQLAHPASPTKCAWQHSFEIPLHNSPCDSPGSGGLLLSAESAEEKSRWICAVNNMILSSLTWKQ